MLGMFDCPYVVNIIEKKRDPRVKILVITLGRLLLANITQKERPSNKKW